MGIAKLLILVGVIGFALHWWSGRQDERILFSEKSVNGFIPVVMPDGVKPNTVVIFAPLNCPSSAAQRAQSLSEKLTRLGIPNVRSSSYSSNITEPTLDDKNRLKRTTFVLNGEIPAVFVGGMAKANPTPDEVVAEYAHNK